MTPTIGITRWEDVPGERLQFYWDRVRDAGGRPVDLHPESDGVRIDALVLTGGLDIDPALYGAERHPKVKRVDPARDAFELAVLQDALQRDIPVLAICRGHQLLNVAFGSTLLQHIDSGEHRAHPDGDMPSRWHTVRFEGHSHLRNLYGRDEIEVNSRHHQAVQRDGLAPGLHAVARSPDGLIEAMESDAHRWVVAVQWHPERLEPEHPAFAAQSAPLFRALVAATREVGELV